MQVSCRHLIISNYSSLGLLSTASVNMLPIIAPSSISIGSPDPWRSVLGFKPGPTGPLNLFYKIRNGEVGVGHSPNPSSVLTNTSSLSVPEVYSMYCHAHGLVATASGLFAGITTTSQRRIAALSPRLGQHVIDKLFYFCPAENEQKGRLVLTLIDFYEVTIHPHHPF